MTIHVARELAGIAEHPGWSRILEWFYEEERNILADLRNASSEIAERNSLAKYRGLVEAKEGLQGKLAEAKALLESMA